MKGFWWAIAIAAFCPFAQGSANASITGEESNSKVDSIPILEQLISVASNQSSNSENESLPLEDMKKASSEIIETFGFINYDDRVEIKNSTFSENATKAKEKETITVPSEVLSSENVTTVDKTTNYELLNTTSYFENKTDAQAFNTSDQLIPIQQEDISVNSTDLTKRVESVVPSASEISGQYQQLHKKSSEIGSLLENIYEDDVSERQEKISVTQDPTTEKKISEEFIFTHEKVSSPLTGAIVESNFTSKSVKPLVARFPQDDSDHEFSKRTQANHVAYQSLKDSLKKKIALVNRKSPNTRLEIGAKRKSFTSNRVSKEASDVIDLNDNGSDPQPKIHDSLIGANNTVLTPNSQTKRRKGFRRPFQKIADAAQEQSNSMKLQRHVNITRVYRQYSSSDKETPPNVSDAPSPGNHYSSGDHHPRRQIDYEPEKPIQQNYVNTNSFISEPVPVNDGSNYQQNNIATHSGLQLFRVPLVNRGNPSTSKQSHQRVFRGARNLPHIQRTRNYGPEDDSQGYYSSFYNQNRPNLAPLPNAATVAPTVRQSPAQPQKLAQRFLLYPMVQKVNVNSNNLNEPNGDSMVILQNGGKPTHEIVISRQLPNNGEHLIPYNKPEKNFKEPEIPNPQFHNSPGNNAFINGNNDHRTSYHSNNDYQAVNGVYDNSRLPKFQPPIAIPAETPVDQHRPTTGTYENSKFSNYHSHPAVPANRPVRHRIANGANDNIRIPKFQSHVAIPAVPDERPRQINIGPPRENYQNQGFLQNGGQTAFISNYGPQQIIPDMYGGRNLGISQIQQGIRQVQQNSGQPNINQYGQSNDGQHRNQIGWTRGDQGYKINQNEPGNNSPDSIMGIGNGGRLIDNNFHRHQSPVYGHNTLSEAEILRQVEQSFNQNGQKIVECEYLKRENNPPQQHRGINTQQMNSIERLGNAGDTHYHRSFVGNPNGHEPTSTINRNVGPASRISEDHSDEQNEVQYVEIYAPEGNNISHLLHQDGEYYIVYKDGTKRKNFIEEQHAQENRNTYSSYDVDSILPDIRDKVQNSQEYLQNSPPKHIAAVGVHLARGLLPHIPPTRSIKSKLSFGVEVVRGHEHESSP